MGKNLYETPRDKDKWNRNVEPLHPVKSNNKTSRSKRLEQLKDRFAKPVSYTHLTLPTTPYV